MFTPFEELPDYNKKGYIHMTVDQIRAMEQTASTTATSYANGTANTSFSSVLQESTSLDSIITKASEKYNVPASLIKAVCKAESNFNAKAVSCCGAQGVMQLMPSTAKSLGVKDAFNPEQNIMGGTKYLSQLLDKYDGNVTYALAAYNAGSGNVAKYGGVPPFKETQNYIKKITGYLTDGVTVPATATHTQTTTATANLTVEEVDAEIQEVVDQLNESLSFEYDDYLDFIRIFMEYLNQEEPDDNEDAKQAYTANSSMPFALQQMLDLI